MKELKHLKEKAIQDTKSKEIFFASMSHELRNPLNALLGTIDLLSNSKKIDQHLLDTAKICGDSLLNLIGKLYFARKEIYWMFLKLKPGN